MKKIYTDLSVSRHFGILLVLTCVICLSLGIFFSSGSKAQEAVAETPAKTAQSPADILDEAFVKLINVAREKGSVRVIVGLRLDGFKLVGDLTQQQRARQKADIEQVQNALLERLASYNVKEVKLFEYMPFLAAEVDAEALEKMRQDAQISSIQEDEAVAPTLAESVSLVGAPAAWTAGFTGSGWSVAVLDTGVDKNHSFLSGKVISEACFSSNFPASNVSSVCPGGVTSSTASNSGLNCSLSISGCNHGTHVAGIAAGTGASFSGVARNANIIAVQVFSRFGNQADCGSATAPCARTYNSDQVRGMERVLTLSGSTNIAAVNMSLGGGNFTTNCDTQYPPEKTAIDNLRSVGIATVISSGNDGFTNAMGFPGCISSAVSVGSTGDGSGGWTTNVVAGYSNSASFLNLLAPGSLINSSVPGGGYSNFNGTSMAAPHVAGAWAILKQKKPTATVTEVLNALTTTGLPVTDFRNGIVKPRIRVDAALQALSGGGGCPPVAISPGQTVNGSLVTSDCVFTGTTRYVDVYSFNGTAGQRIAVSLSSSAFDTYLYLVNSSNQIVGEDDDGGGGTNSRIPAGSGYLTLPASGTYLIYATSYFADATGAYSLTLVNEPTACAYLISPSSQSFTTAGGSSSTTVSTQSGCAWSSSSNAGWITVSGGGSGGGAANFSVAVNTGAARTGTMVIAGQIFTVNQAGVTAANNRTPSDFDGDRKTDISIFRPSNGQWWIQRSGGGTYATTFGVSTDRIAPADYTGDGKTDIAFFRPSNGGWFILRSENGTFYSFAFGTNGDTPAPADYDGDGRADAAVFRPSNATWYIFRSSDNGTTIQQFGANGDIPTPAFYDADNRADIAVYRPSTGVWWLSRSASGVIAYQFGNASDKPVAGDFTGDGRADNALFRPSTGEWFVLRSENGTFYSFPFGTFGDMSAAGDYDGDGKFDAAIYRPSNSTWYVNKSTGGSIIQTYGIGGDRPVPGAFVP